MFKTYPVAKMHKIVQENIFHLTLILGLDFRDHPHKRTLVGKVLSVLLPNSPL